MSEFMKAVVFKKQGEVVIEEFEIPPIPDDKVLVKIDSCAICTWEQRVYTGQKKVDFPFVGGHEMSGQIIQMGSQVDKRSWKIGDKVVVGVTLPCKNCDSCKSGNEQNCNYFNHTKDIAGIPYKGMGGLTSHMIVSPVNLFHFSGISYEEATIAEPISCVVHSIDTANIQLGEVVVVLGCGIMGLLHVQLATSKGACVIAADINPKRLEMALKMGAKMAVNTEEKNLSDAVSDFTRGEKAQVIFDTVPNTKLVGQSLELVANNGRMVLYSSFYPDSPVSFSPDWLHKSGASLMGTANSNTSDFVKATRLLSYGCIQVKEFIDEVYPVEQVKEAFESSAKGDKFRVIVKF